MKRRKPTEDLDKYLNKGGDSQNNPIGDLNDMPSQAFDDDDEHTSYQITEDTPQKTEIINKDGGANIPDDNSHDYEGDSLGSEVESTGEFYETTSQVPANIGHETSLIHKGKLQITYTVNNDGGPDNPEADNDDSEGDFLGFEDDSTGDLEDTASKLPPDSAHELSLIRERLPQELVDIRYVAGLIRRGTLQITYSDNNDIGAHKPDVNTDKYEEDSRGFEEESRGDFNETTSQIPANIGHETSLIQEDILQITDTVNNDDGRDNPHVDGDDNEGDFLGFEDESTGDLDGRASQLPADSAHELSLIRKRVPQEFVDIRFVAGLIRDGTLQITYFDNNDGGAHKPDVNINKHERDSRGFEKESTGDFNETTQEPADTGHETSLIHEGLLEITYTKNKDGGDDKPDVNIVENEGDFLGFEEESTGDLEDTASKLPPDSLDDDIYVPKNISFRKFLSKMKKLKPLTRMAETKFFQEITQTSINLHKCLMLSNNLKYYTHVADSFNYNEPDVRKLKRKLKYDYRYRFYEKINE